MHTTMKVFAAAAAITWLAGGAEAQTQQGTQPMAQPGTGVEMHPHTPPAAVAPQPSAATGAAQDAAGSQPVLVTSESLIGAKVRDSQGQELGSVKQLMLDAQKGTIQYAVVGMGGTLGMNDKQVAVPWESLKLTRDEDEVIVTAERQVLEQAPAHRAQVDDAAERMEESDAAEREAAEDIAD